MKWNDIRVHVRISLTLNPGYASLFFALRSGGQQLPRRGIPTLDQCRKLQLPHEAFFRRLGPSCRYETIHFFLHGLTFAAPLLKNRCCHQIPLPTQPERWNLATLDGAGKVPNIFCHMLAANVQPQKRRASMAKTMT